MIITAVYLLSSRVTGAGRPEVTELLQRCQAAQENVRSFIDNGVCTKVSTDSREPGPQFKREMFEFRTDGDRIACRIHRSSDQASQNVSPAAESTRYASFLWDGKSFFHYNKQTGFDGKAFVKKHDRVKSEMVSIMYEGAPLSGVFYGDLSRVDSILGEADSISLRNNTEKVNGSECFVIEASTKHGEYTVWIDPEHGYNIARAQVHKKENDLAWGKPLNFISAGLLGQPAPQVRAAFSFSIQNVHFEEIDGVWVPMGADYQRIHTYAGGRVLTINSSYKRTSINLNPDFETINAFVPDDIPDGTRVYLEGVDGIFYRWQDGELVPDIDEFAIDLIDHVTGEKLNENSDSAAEGSVSRMDEPAVQTDRHERAETTSIEQGATRPHQEVPPKIGISSVIALAVAGSVILGVVACLVSRRFRRRINGAP